MALEVHEISHPMKKNESSAHLHIRYLFSIPTGIKRQFLGFGGVGWWDRTTSSERSHRRGLRKPAFHAAKAEIECLWRWRRRSWRHPPRLGMCPTSSVSSMPTPQALTPTWLLVFNSTGSTPSGWRGDPLLTGLIPFRLGYCFNPSQRIASHCIAGETPPHLI